MKLIQYFRLNGLIEYDKGAFQKALVILFSQMLLLRLFFSNEGTISFLHIGIFVVFIFSHSLVLKPDNIVMKFPITYKKRYLFDLIAILYYTILTTIFFAIIGVFIVLLAKIFNGNIISNNESYNITQLPGDIYYTIYTIMLIFSVQLLKYIRSTRIFYITYTSLFILFLTIHTLTASLINNKFTMSSNISETLYKMPNHIIYLSVFTIISTIYTFFIIKKSLQLAKP